MRKSRFSEEQMVAMSVLASGALSPREAIEYISRQPKIEAIVFGASSRANIHQTKVLIDELTRPAVASNPVVTV